MREDSWQLHEGDALTSALTVVRLLGGGAAYEAYLVFDEITFMPVVAKVLRPSQVTNESALRGLRREVDALAAINHPVVVRGLRHELEGDRPHVVLEQIDGPRLSTLTRRYSRLQPQQYLPLAMDIAAALHYFARVGWVHLDIKPSNVIMGAPGRLIDLSVARTVSRTAELTYAIGTDAYMAPEQADPTGRWTPSPASDVWGLGATLFQAIAGVRPFRKGDPTASSAVDRFPQLAEAPGALPSDVDRGIVAIVRACLEIDPDNRPQPHQISDELGPVLASLPRGSLAGFKIR